MQTGKQIVYTYDFGDNWKHTLTVERRGDFTDHFVCLAGTGHPVVEDVSGVEGWKDLKAAYRAAQPTQEQRERREWFEKRARNVDPRGLAGDRAGEPRSGGYVEKVRPYGRGGCVGEGEVQRPDYGAV